ncbi:hypothetical protein BGW36DRAFT_444309 [Talaromyces proteolyticus]|uniref:TNT domain-containing protein n=1 Tax=Talaromyces proteolyticus TaxID=1131652 RepID=A0AAD4KYA2_9EURO|nr:uncharacterized protein BGW36DRAFT_444309 [Talaromyces proteolyticus]KAH8703780.1 hypothetical protein BGW36DRAFT_444309 [Talaromyces proteolyticus]
MLFNIVCTIAFCHFLLIGRVLAQTPTTTVPAFSRCTSPCPTETPVGQPDPRFVCGDNRLGPVDLPSEPPIAEMLGGYEQFGGLCPRDYFYHWFSDINQHYINPPGNGFLLDAYNRSMYTEVTIPVGTLLDRFGGLNASYLSILGTDYVRRSISPGNLSRRNSTTAAIYYVFNVTQPIPAQYGRSAPWYGQPGGELQYYLPNSSTQILIDQGSLELIESL